MAASAEKFKFHNLALAICKGNLLVCACGFSVQRNVHVAWRVAVPCWFACQRAATVVAALGTIGSSAPFLRSLCARRRSAGVLPARLTLFAANPSRR